MEFLVLKFLKFCGVYKKILSVSNKIFDLEKVIFWGYDIILVVFYRYFYFIWY